MPVEILELIVRAEVQEPSAQAPATQTRGEDSEDKNFERQVLIEECVEQVLEILRHRQQR